MSDKEQKTSGPGENQPTDAEIEREVRSSRRFSLAEAIGRSAGNLMKGASPVTREQQAVFEIEQIIERHLDDAEGALAPELLRRVKASEILLENYGDPKVALVRVTRDLLASADSLRHFITRVDAEWGRIYLEHPHFDRENTTPDRDDPYTRDSVRATLEALLVNIESEESTQS